MISVERCENKDFVNASENGTYDSMDVFGEYTRGFKYKGCFYYKNFSRNVYYKVTSA